jgi:hypothetical protein
MAAILLPKWETQNRIVPAHDKPYTGSLALHRNLLDIWGKSG